MDNYENNSEKGQLRKSKNWKRAIPKGTILRKGKYGLNKTGKL